MKLIYNLQTIGISNPRIEEHFNSLKSIDEQNKYCGDLIDKKQMLNRYFNQCNQLQLQPKIDYINTLENIDLIQISKISTLIENNISLAKTLPRFLKNISKPKNIEIRSKKRKLIITDEEYRVFKLEMEAQKLRLKNSKKKKGRNIPRASIIYIGRQYY